MSMQSVLGVVGGVIGSFFGYPQLGFMVGSLVGGLLTPKEKTEGPRLDDLKVQVSTYGSGIPILYGTERIGGNVVWSTDKIETSTTEEVGKGGGAENTSYRYFVHMRIVLCETPRDGSPVSLVQIFQDGKLKWDARSSIPMASALASEENLFAFFTLYQGDSAQLPDPVEEIYSGGSGSVPAYRGVVSISMKAIECPGGRVPQFSFVLSTNATTVPLVQDYTVITTASDDQRSVINKDGVWQFSTDDASEVSEVWLGLPNNSNLATTVPGMIVGYARSPLVPIQGSADPEAARVVVTESSVSGYAEPVQLQVFNMKTGTSQILWEYIPGVAANQLTPNRGAKDSVSGAYIFTAVNGIYELAPLIIDGALRYQLPTISGLIDVAFYAGIVYVLRNDAGATYVRRYSAQGVFIDELVAPQDADDIRSRIRADEKGVFVLLNVGEPTLVTYFYQIDFAGSGWVELAVTAGVPNTDANFDTFYATDDYAIVGSTSTMSDTVRTYHMVRFKSVTTAEVMVKDIIVDQCQRSGETRYDVSDIPDEDTIHGYKLQNPASARNNVDPLLTAFAIFIVDEDGLIKFKKYEDITSEATISYDELGQAEDGSEPSDAMPLNRAQEIDLPKSVSVSYIEETFDYQTATEKEERQVTEANEDLMIELPIATDSDHAKKVAQMILFARWRAQNTRSLKVSRKYAFLSPGDGITVEYPRGTSRLWRIMSLTDTGALIELTVEPGDAEIYTQTAVGATDYVRQEVEPLAAPTRAQLLDMPIIRDEDNDAGIYVALDSYADVPAKAELFVGDSDEVLESRGTVAASSPIGFAETILSGWSSVLIDETNLVTINIGDDTFSSVTRDVLIAGGAQYWAYGAPGRWEIGASATADSLGSGRYTLSRHLRGQFGTERNTGNHAVGDTFVLLREVGILRPSSGVGALGQEMSYRAVTKGRSLNSTSSIRYANTGEGLRPLSPINLRKSKNASNDITLTWDRRSRLAINPASGSLPLGEAAELYSVEFYTSSGFTTLAGTLTTTTASLTITSAQQTAMGLTPGGTVYVRVRQVSDSVGIGHELQATK